MMLKAYKPTLQDIPTLETRIDEARAAIKEDRILECSVG